jgi:hypothetical protein
LIASGGSLKPEKCFFYLISFTWNADGKWSYAANENEEEFRLGVPLPDDSEMEIEHIVVWCCKRNTGCLDVSNRRFEGTIPLHYTKRPKVDRPNIGKSSSTKTYDSCLITN